MARATARSCPSPEEERAVHHNSLLYDYAQGVGGDGAAFEIAQDSLNALAGRHVLALDGVPADRVAAIGVIAMLMDIGHEVQKLRKDVQRLGETVGEVAQAVEGER